MASPIGQPGLGRARLASATPRRDGATAAITATAIARPRGRTLVRGSDQTSAADAATGRASHASGIAPFGSSRVRAGSGLAMNRSLVVVERLAERVPAAALRDEIEELRARRLEHRHDSIGARVRD